MTVEFWGLIVISIMYGLTTSLGGSYIVYRLHKREKRLEEQREQGER